MSRDKIVAGLTDAIGFAKGEEVGARVTMFPAAPPLVERLRQYVQIADGDKMTVILCDDLTEAADKIELLTRALGDLEQAATSADGHAGPNLRICIERARKALT